MDLTLPDQQTILKWGLFFLYTSPQWIGLEDNTVLQKFLHLVVPNEQQIKVNTIDKSNETKGNISLEILQEKYQKAKKHSLDQWVK
jgi:hypothetical protein